MSKKGSQVRSAIRQVDRLKDRADQVDREVGNDEFFDVGQLSRYHVPLADAELNEADRKLARGVP